MRRIAIVTPCILPVPATLGGAVEELITRIIKDNEKQNDYLIDLFSVRGDSEDDSIFSRKKLWRLRYAFTRAISTPGENGFVTNSSAP